MTFCQFLENKFAVCFVYMAIFFLFLSCSPLSDRKEALQVVAEADSLDRIGRLYSDTTRLLEASKTLSEYRYRTEKAKALYYLGRNYSMQNLDATAVDCYIDADRLKPEDPQLRGRLNANMAYICAQQNKDSLALIFYEKDCQFWEMAGEKEIYCSCLLDISHVLCKMKQYAKSDSIWKMTLNYSHSERFLSRASGLRAYYFNEVCEYDSALFYLDKITMPEVLGLDFYNSQRVIALYYTDHIDSAVFYANKVVNDSISRVAFLISSYNILREKAYRDNDIGLTIIYNEQLEKFQIDADSNSEQRIRAIAKMEKYLNEEEDNSILFLVIAISVSIIILAIGLLYIYRTQNKYKFLQERNSMLNHKENLILASISEQANNIQTNISHIKQDKNWKNTLKWNNEKQSLLQIDYYFNNFATRLNNEYNLNPVDIRYCAMLLMGFDTKYISEHLPYAYSGMKTLKKRTANKLYVLPQDLPDFLADFALFFRLSNEDS